MLELLIIFMVAARCRPSICDRSADLVCDAGEEADKPTYVSITGPHRRDRGNPVSAAELVSTLNAAAGSDKDHYIFLRTDRAVGLRRPDGRDGNFCARVAYSKIKLVAARSQFPAAAPPPAENPKP